MSDDHMSVKSQMIRLTAADGHIFDAFHAAPGGTNKGGLVVLQEVFGVTDQMKSVAVAYAEQGFEAIVPALFDRASPGEIVPFDNPDRGRDLAFGIPPEQVMMDVAAAAAKVAERRHASVLGFCWGGGLAIQAAAVLDVASGISFYGTRLLTLLDPAPKCPTLFHFGAKDTHSPPDVIDTVKKAVPTAETYVYEAGHAFANDARAAFVPEAAAAARERTIRFLNRVHGAA